MGNPIDLFLSASYATKNPMGYTTNKIYGSDIAKSSEYSPTGKTNLANAIKGFLMTGDFVGAIIGFGSNSLSVTGTNKNSDGSTTRTTYATPFSVAGAYANPVGFAVGTAYNSEMARSTNKTSTGHTNIANSVLGGLAFGGVGAVVGGLANLLGGLFGSKKTDTSKTNITTPTVKTDINFSPENKTFGSVGYTGFGSDAYAQSSGISPGKYGSIGYTGFGSDSYGKNLSSQNTTNPTYGDKNYTGFGSTSYANTNISPSYGLGVFGNSGGNNGGNSNSSGSGSSSQSSPGSSSPSSSPGGDD